MKKFLQSIADHIIKKLGETSDNEMFHFYYDMGLMLNSFAINYFDIYLD